jgi:hypothetical protein
MKCNETLSKWCKNKHGALKIIDTLETYHLYAYKTIKKVFLKEGGMHGLGLTHSPQLFTAPATPPTS